MVTSKYIFRRTKEKMLNELVANNTKKYYHLVRLIEDTDEKIFFISIISEIANGIFDFYLDINRTNNVFYMNINRINEKLIKEIFVLNSMFFLLKILDETEDAEKTYITYNMQKVFKYSKKDKRTFSKYQKLYDEDIDSFTIKFIHNFSKKFFSTKDANKMEFAYIDYYLENSYKEFRSVYVKSVV